MLYQDVDLDVMEVNGDRAAVERLVAAFDGVIEVEMESTPVRLEREKN